MIYAIQSGEFVKIGFSDTPNKRLRAIQVSSPVKCILLGVMEGTMGTEDLIHKRFSSIRVQGEWFRLTPELKAWIGSQMQPVEQPDPAPKQEKIGNSSRRVSVRVDPDSVAFVNQYATENDLTISESIRIALDRLFKSEPTALELECSAFQIGRPKH